MFATLEIYNDIDSRTAALNMAIDEALLEGATQPTIRFYRWNHPALSFGYFGRYADVENHESQRDIVRRWTGGGIVFHGRDLTYSIVIPASDSAFAGSSMSIYEKVHGALRDTLIAKAERGAACCSHAPVARQIRDWPAEHNGPQGRGYNQHLCFANPVRADVMLNGRKIAGAAQRRTRRGLLQQGSIQNIDLGNDFADQFAHELCRERSKQQVADTLLERAQQIAEQKYKAESWLRRR